MSAPAIEYVVHGTKEVNAAFTRLDTRVDPVVGKALRDLAKPVQKSAQEYALERVTNMGQAWSRMRIGRNRLTVYVAEKERGTRGLPGRPNLYPLLMSQALQPALKEHEEEIRAGVALVVEKMLREEF